MIDAIGGLQSDYTYRKCSTGLIAAFSCLNCTRSYSQLCLLCFILTGYISLLLYVLSSATAVEGRLHVRTRSRSGCAAEYCRRLAGAVASSHEV